MSLFGYRATFAILKGPMAITLGWSASQVTLGYSLMRVFYAVTAYFSGMILDKWGTKPRREVRHLRPLLRARQARHRHLPRVRQDQLGLRHHERRDLHRLQGLMD